MPQHSKVIHSRGEWKRKASQRAYENRELKKTVKRQGQKIAEIKAQNKLLSETVKDNKKNG